jgi:hypothetical protein
MSCEFGQTVQVMPVASRPGHYALVFKKKTYNLERQQTTTGAVRLEDRKAGVVWLQISVKSMMLNTKIGQRMVDNCLHEEQRLALPPPGSSLGIAEAAEVPPGAAAAQDPVPVPAAAPATN